MDEHVAKLQGQIARGEYEVDPRAVAEAIITKLRLRALARARLQQSPSADKECSKPDSDPSTSMNVTPVSPSTTRPIQVSPAPLGQAALAVSAAARAVGGIQAQSS
jgi:hypothetical protein